MEHQELPSRREIIRALAARIGDLLVKAGAIALIAGIGGAYVVTHLRVTFYLTGEQIVFAIIGFSATVATIMETVAEKDPAAAFMNYAYFVGCIFALFAAEALFFTSYSS